ERWWVSSLRVTATAKRRFQPQREPLSVCRDIRRTTRCRAFTAKPTLSRNHYFFTGMRGRRLLIFLALFTNPLSLPSCAHPSAEMRKSSNLGKRRPCKIRKKSRNRSKRRQPSPEKI